MRKTFQHLRIEDIQSFYELVIYNFSFQEEFCVLIAICEKSHLLKWVLIIHRDCNMRLVMYWYNFQALGLTVLTVLANQEFDFWGPLRTADSYSTRSETVSYVKLMRTPPDSFSTQSETVSYVKQCGRYIEAIQEEANGWITEIQNAKIIDLLSCWLKFQTCT